MNKTYPKSSNDYSGLIFKYINIIKLIGYKYIFTLINKLQLYLKNVKIGKNCIFIGRTLIHRQPKSFITIGNACDFRSTQFSNLIGLNRKCSLSTLRQAAIITIGNNCGLSGTVIAAFSNIELGNNVKCGANTLITDSNWHLDDPRSGEPKSITIKDNVWLGVNSIILKGVTIGRNTVIGANSVVVKAIPSNVVASGNPAKVIRKLTSDEIINLENISRDD